MPLADRYGRAVLFSWRGACGVCCLGRREESAVTITAAHTDGADKALTGEPGELGTNDRIGGPRGGALVEDPAGSTSAQCSKQAATHPSSSVVTHATVSTPRMTRPEPRPSGGGNGCHHQATGQSRTVRSLLADAA